MNPLDEFLAPGHISLPSSLPASNSGPMPLTNAELRERRLRAAGHELTTCPVCGQLATREQVTVHRPGQPSLLRVVLRCQGIPAGELSSAARCPAVIEAETVLEGPPPVFELPKTSRRPVRRQRTKPESLPAPVTPPPDVPDAMPADAGPEVPMTEKKCLDCGATLPDPHGRQKRCESCAETAERSRKQADYRRRRQARHAEPTDGKCPCGCDVPVKPGNRYATAGCATRYRGRVKPQAPAMPAPSPDLVERVRQAPPLTLVRLAEGLLLLPQEERDAVLRLVQLEQVREGAVA